MALIDAGSLQSAGMRIVSRASLEEIDIQMVAQAVEKTITPYHPEFVFCCCFWLSSCRHRCCRRCCSRVIVVVVIVLSLFAFVSPTSSFVRVSSFDIRGFRDEDPRPLPAASKNCWHVHSFFALVRASDALTFEDSPPPPQGQGNSKRAPYTCVTRAYFFSGGPKTSTAPYGTQDQKMSCNCTKTRFRHAFSDDFGLCIIFVAHPATGGPKRPAFSGFRHWLSVLGETHWRTPYRGKIQAN